MHDFGGVARYASHWTGWIYPDGGSGQCFPAGHATTGFAFVGGFFALRHARPRLARVWLWSALTFGMVLGIGQQLRGAHFMSHTLWTGWLCWMTAWLSDPLHCPSFQGTLQLNSRHYKMTASTETFTNLHKTRRGLDRLLHAAGLSAAGLRHGWSEPAFRFEAILALVMLPGSIWLGRTWVETAVLAGTVLLVLIVELLNTAI